MWVENQVGKFLNNKVLSHFSCALFWSALSSASSAASASGFHSCIRENANAAQHLRQLRSLQTLPWALGILADSGMGQVAVSSAEAWGWAEEYIVV
jgi:hypothetical protein